MPTPKIDPRENLRRVQAYLDAVEDGHSPLGTVASGGQLSAVNIAAQRIGVPSQTIRDAIRRMQHDPSPALDGLPADGMRVTARNIQYDEAGRLTRQSVQMKRDAGEEYAIPEGYAVKGESALLDAEGRVLNRWVKTARDTTQATVDAIREAFSQPLPKAPAIASPKAANDDLLTVYPIPDVHIGLMAWAKEAGADYDLSIARDTILQAVAELLGTTPASGHAVILWLGDTTHQNDRTNMTPRSGHVLDTDGRFHKVLFTAAQIIQSVTDMVAAKHKRVTVRVLEGNHDPEASLALMLATAVRYEGHQRIKVDTSPGLHFYMRFGRVLIGATHGHTMKPAQMAMMLACDRKEDWGASDFKHFFYGHIHQTKADEIGNVIVEAFQSPAARDAYAHGSGWRSGRSLSAITFHAMRGEHLRAKVAIG